MTKYYCDCCGVEVDKNELFSIAIAPYFLTDLDGAFSRMLCKGCVRRNILKLFADGDDWL